MNIKQPQYIFSALALAVVVGLSGPALAQSAAGSRPGAAAPSAASKAAQPQVDDKVAREAAGKRAKLAQDAITALAKTHEALILLDARKTKEALAALELASGKLELVLARDPKLALAPVDVRVITHDIHADVESVKKAVKLSRELLDDGEVQKARPIVANLASEIVIETDNLPMATYPAAIKSAARLIDSGKIDDAKAVLARALNTMVMTSVAFPLPVLRAEAAMAKAEKLAETGKRNAKQSEELSALLAYVRTEIELAQILGYGKKADFKPIFDQVKAIEQKSAGGKSGKGWFDELKMRIQRLS
ncbi:heat resistance protein YfdX1 [Stenotrophomonas maltophilia]|uniref:heat resistance protein YfdX1 n=1 Tax=Stenotrophomonas maltophilia TaxID=40324 RepID=UPI002E7739CD|nr:heat resistance protein YfdX1 [Stenotrophomonas maltophilia]